jgi:putative membrane protein
MAFMFFSQGLILAVLLARPTWTAFAAEYPPTTGGSEEATPHKGNAATFIKEAMQGNNLEVALAEVAEHKSQNADVKKLAAVIQKDHQQANDKLMPIAQAHGVAAESTLDTKHQKVVDRFQNMSGSEFDKEFAKEMLRGHQRAIAKYEKAVQDISDPDVKQYAQTTLPELREHLQQTKQTAQAVGIDSATISSILKESSSSMGGTGDDSEQESGSKGSAPSTPPPMPEEKP